MNRTARLFAVAGLILCAACRGDGGTDVFPFPDHPNGGKLWQIVHEQCVPEQKTKGSPEPCARVSLTGPEDQGYVFLKDRNGIAQYLLLPTQKITGIEDPKVRTADSLHYFALAWDARQMLNERLGKTLPQDFVSVAVNSRYGRSQDQLHLHLDCLSVAAHDDLARHGGDIARHWSSPIVIAGHAYRIRRLPLAALETTNLFRLLAESLPDAGGNMGAWTLALAGDDTEDVYLLAGKADPAAGDWGSAELLQDHDCNLPQ